MEKPYREPDDTGEEHREQGDDAGEPVDPAGDDTAPGRVKRTANKVAGSVSSVVKQALVARDHVLMVRVNDESLEAIANLKDAGLFRSRSEAAAYLIAEGINAKADLFARISQRIQQIQEIKDELRTLAGRSGMAGDDDPPPEDER